MTIERWECWQCQWEGVREDLQNEIVFAGNREEPPEYLDHCPECNSTNITEINMILCISCEDKEVKNDGDMCTECATCQHEMECEKSRGH